MRITINGKESIDVPSNTTYYELSKKYQPQYKWPIVGAKMDHNLVSLSSVIQKSGNIEFLDGSSNIGRLIYENSCSFILIKAVHNIFGAKTKILFDYSVEHGIYCTISEPINKEILTNIENEMHSIIKSHLPIKKLNVSRLEAINYFKKSNRLDKANALRYISNTYITLFELDGIYDYFNSQMVPFTSMINLFELKLINDHDFVLVIPKIINNELVMNYKHHPNVNNTFKKYSDWCEMLEVNNAGQLNKIVSSGKINELIRLSETYYDVNLSNIANDIASNKNIKLVLLAGPSSSGKTTTSKKISTFLKAQGINTYSISMDDFFVEEAPIKDEFGECDYENINRIDIHLFNKTIKNLLENKEVEMPTYNFKMDRREYNGNKLQLKEKDILIIEGIHALNDTLLTDINRIYKYKIFIMPLVKINIDDHNYIHSSDIRKLRRIIRDNRIRGMSVSDTLGMWKKIASGERKYIFPYQDDVDSVINSSLVYELGVLKTYAEPLLFDVTSDNPIYDETIRLINFLRYFLPIPSDQIPDTSILREFIGRSIYEK